jgi:exopolyphosphatase/guanosine-5'-triphosphate,3'-diphosphate pyrophosphatase
MTEEKDIAVADLGSNSARLVLMSVYPDQSFKLADEIRESLRLAEHLDEDGNLSPEIMDRATETGRVFARFCRARNVKEIVATATSAVREAKNGKDLVRRLFEETGVEYAILSGEEEAYFGYLGVVNSLSLTDGLIVDIGGGSAEIVRIANRQAVELTSLPLGAITLTQKFLSPDALSTGELEKLEEYIARAFRSVPWLESVYEPSSRSAKGGSAGKAPRRLKESKNGKKLRSLGSSPTLVGLGGTIRNVGKIYKRKVHYPLDLLHGLSVPLEAVEEIYNELRGMTLSQRKEVPGLSQSRADIFVGGMATLLGLARAVEAQELIVSGRGLRDGLFYHQLLAGEKEGPLVDDPAVYATRNQMRYYQAHEAHCQRVAQLALSLFDQLQPLHGLGFEERRLLNIGGLLHDVGIAVNYYNHGEHGLYLLTRTGIDGLTHRELVMVGYAVAAHSESGSPLKRWPDYRSLLQPGDEDAIAKMGALLRVAEALDRSESGSIQSLACQILPDGAGARLIPTAFANGSFELREAQAALPELEKAFGKRLTLAVGS